MHTKEKSGIDMTKCIAFQLGDMSTNPTIELLIQLS